MAIVDDGDASRTAAPDEPSDLERELRHALLRIAALRSDQELALAAIADLRAANVALGTERERLEAEIAELRLALAQARAASAAHATTAGQEVAALRAEAARSRLAAARYRRLRALVPRRIRSMLMAGYRRVRGRRG